MTTERYTLRPQPAIETTPFATVEDAWFWFVQAQQARSDGARYSAGAGLVPRPCEPVDILTILTQLHRSRRLTMDHLLVLRHYGRRMMAPDPRRAKEVRAHDLWVEALERLEPALMRKGIIEERSLFDSLRTSHANKFWSPGAVITKGSTVYETQH